ncbi:MAG: hypothetical protein IM638_19450 [Bacteroidetes bacterium]|nr:hypothetical protein [Bacteroidota bacterium]
MELEEIQILFSNELNRNLLTNEAPLLYRFEIQLINSIGIPKLSFDKFIPCNEGMIDNKLVFSKSIISPIYLGIDGDTKEVVCFSNIFKSYSFVNTDYESFIRSIFTYEVFRSICLKPQKLGEYYENSPYRGNYHKYSELLHNLINIVDTRATIEGHWASLIDEMKIGAK